MIETPETSGVIPVDKSTEMKIVQGSTEAPMHSRHTNPRMHWPVTNEIVTTKQRKPKLPTF